MAQKKKVDYQKSLSYPKTLREMQRLRARIVELEWEVNNEWTFNLQQFLDCAAIGLHDAHGFGPSRNQAAIEAIKKRLVEFMTMSLREVRETEQGKDCFDFWATQGRMDKAVRAALGPDVPDWSERYSEEHLAELLKDMRRYKFSALAGKE